MKTKLPRFHRTLVAAAAGFLGLLLEPTAATATPVVVFSPLTNNQTVADLSAIGGSVSNDLPIASVDFSVRELDIHGGPGRWWNGGGFQPDPVDLPAVMMETNWVPD